jgi:hypothetical protein
VTLLGGRLEGRSSHERANKTSKSKMNPLVVFAILTIFAVAECRFLIVRTDEIALPASEKISKRSAEEGEEHYLDEPVVVPLEDPDEKVAVVKRSISDLYANMDDLRFRFFHKGLIRERF